MATQPVLASAPMNERSPARRGKLIRSVGRGLSLAAGIGCALFFLHEVRSQWRAFGGLAWSPSTLAGFVAALVTLIAAGLVDAYTWGWLLRRMGVPANLTNAASIFCQAQFAKYLPGNVGQHVGRMELARRQGWQLGRVALSLVIENGLAVGSGALFAGFGLLMIGTGGVDSRLPALAAALVAGTLVAAAIVRAVLARPPAIVQRALKLEGSIHLTWSFVFAMLLVHLASHLANAFTLGWLLLGSGAGASSLWRVPAVATVAWLSGYLLPGAPAGLGVRELVISRLLASHTGEAAALSAALLWRCAALSADAVLLGLGSVLRRTRSQAQTSDALERKVTR